MLTDEQRTQTVGPGRGDLTAAMFPCALVALAASVGFVVTLAGNLGADRTITRAVSADAFTITSSGKIVPDEVLGRIVASRGAYAIDSLGGALQVGAVALAATLLFRIVNDARRGSPFLGRNATRLRVVRSGSRKIDISSVSDEVRM